MSSGPRARFGSVGVQRGAECALQAHYAELQGLGHALGHGAQKLFGLFEGHGPEGTGFFFEKLGLRPGKQWAITAGLGETGGGLLTLLGFLQPVGPITTLAPMIVAWGRAHWGKPIWVTS